MSKLTGKCKEDFLVKIYYQEDTNQASDESIIEKVKFHAEKWLERQDKRFINSLIIEFFDSKGINIIIENLDFQNWWSFKIKYFPDLFEDNILYKSRQEAINKAIEQANKIYNKKYE